MARKNKERIVLEDVELKPQVIGYTYQKKSNLGRVILIFVAFSLAVFYINDISEFINDLLGKETAPSIKENVENNKDKNPINNDINKITYNVFSNTLEFVESGLTLNNFNFIDNVLTFDVTNKTNKSINLKDKKLFLEFYNENKTLIERHKIDLEIFASQSKINYSFNLNNNFYFLVLEEKTINDYPVINLEKNEYGESTLTCEKLGEQLTYRFVNDELVDINHTITNNDVNNENYYANYSTFQNKVTTYNNMEGISATFTGTINGYKAIFAINLAKVNLTKLDEKYYYSYKTIPKEVKFEMESYGYICK